MQILTYIQLLNKLENKQINPFNYYLRVNDETYTYNGFEFVNNEGVKFISKFVKSESELINLKVYLYKKDEKMIKNSNYEIKKLRQAKGEIIKELWDRYLDLDWDISVTQGCIDDLDKQYEKVHIYKRLLEYMGVCVEKDKNKKFDKWYTEQINKQKETEENKNKQLEPLGINWMQLAQYEDTEIKPILELYTELAHRLNDVLTYLRNKDNKEKEKDK